MQVSLSICNFKKIIRIGVFLLVFSIIFSYLQNILIRKDGNYYRQKQIYNLPKNSIDLMIIGSSHSDNGFIPEVFDEVLKLNSYNMGRTGARIEQVEFLLKEYLKSQNPKILLIEGFSFTPIANEHYKVLANWSFDSFKFSLNKVNAIFTTTKEKRIYHIFPILEYHDRWKKSETKDLEEPEKYYNRNKGWGTSNKKLDKKDNWFESDFSLEKNEREINISEKRSLENIIKICKKNNIKLYIVTLPYKNQLGMNAQEITKVNNYLKNKYKEEIILYNLNENYKKNNTTYSEFIDEGHLNITGAYKYSRLVAKFIKNMENEKK